MPERLIIMVQWVAHNEHITSSVDFPPLLTSPTGFTPDWKSFLVKVPRTHTLYRWEMLKLKVSSSDVMKVDLESNGATATGINRPRRRRYRIAISDKTEGCRWTGAAVVFALVLGAAYQLLNSRSKGQRVPLFWWTTTTTSTSTGFRLISTGVWCTNQTP